MKRTQLRRPTFLCSSLFYLLISAGFVNAQQFPDYGYQPPTDWEGATFSLSQSYPTVLPAKSELPWESIDFQKEPEKYLWAVLNYGYEGNLEVDFEVQKNPKRNWFHAPWLHYGPNAREFVRGLTRERSSRPFEIAATQTQQYRNYAVGFYDALGGYTIGQVWKNPINPDSRLAKFPEGTVTFKLLFSTAPSSQVPFLEGAPEWVADIDQSPSSQQILNNKVRLLQIDIAVKDKRSFKGGWVFGTFHYDKAINNENPWLRLRPLSLMWGDDESLAASDYANGKRPSESWVNELSPVVSYRSNPPSGVTPPSTLGLSGRANGPVDNPASSCLSCHGTAQIPATVNMIPPPTLPDSEKMQWFRNTKPGEALDPSSVSLDYSLQLGVGIQNVKAYQASLKNLGGFFSNSRIESTIEATSKQQEYRFTREPE
jgi:hypothetical protein